MDARVGWEVQKAYGTLDPKIATRWSSFGPYYAMFPIDFARKVISDYTDAGDFVLDPFSGRGTSVFCAAEAGRDGLGIEINPVGWLYATVKLNPCSLKALEARLVAVSRLADPRDPELAGLPPFYRMCFCKKVLSFLLACRRELNWRSSKIDATLMAFVIIYLHGRIGKTGLPQALSNQMRQTKAMSPEYSLRWWRDNGFKKPPEVDPVAFLKERIVWRYARGAPDFPESIVKFGDARSVLSRLPPRVDATFKLLLTSPPYCGVTSYYIDQWLRLWMLGETEAPIRAGAGWKGKFEGREKYKDLLETVFSRSARLMAPNAVIYVRTDAREFTRETTIEALAKAFPGKRKVVKLRPFVRTTQTALFGDKEKKPGEVDIILK